MKQHTYYVQQEGSHSKCKKKPLHLEETSTSIVPDEATGYKCLETTESIQYRVPIFSSGQEKEDSNFPKRFSLSQSFHTPPLGLQTQLFLMLKANKIEIDEFVYIYQYL